MKQNENESIGKWISILHTNAKIYLNANFKKFNIGDAQIRLLMFIFKNPGIRQENLCTQFYKDKGTIARSIKKLESANLIYRKKDITDNRAYNIFPTENALNHFDEIKNIFQEWTKILTIGFTEEEKDQALHLLRRMSNNIDLKKESYYEEKKYE